MSHLTNSLKSAERSKRLRQGFGKALSSLKFLVIGFILLLSLDVIFHLYPEQRIQGLIIFALLFSAWGIYLFYRSFIASQAIKKTALELELKDPKLGSSLINSIELQQQIDEQKVQGLSKELAETAIKEYNQKWSNSQLKEVINPGQLARQFRLAVLSLAIIGVCLIPIRHILGLELLRFFDPHGDHPAFSLTQLEVNIPSDDFHKVIYGDDININAMAAGHQPKELYLSFYPLGQAELKKTLPMFNRGELGFSQKIENVQSELELFVHTKDLRSVSKKRLTGIILTPEVTSAFTTVTPPAYTGHKSRTFPFKWNNLTVLKGSQVSFSLHSNRPLSSGSIELINAENKTSIELTKNAEKEVTGAFVAESNQRLRFIVKDVNQLESKQLLKGNISIRQDLPPTVQFLSLENHSYVTQDFSLRIHLQANDDFGIEEMRLHRALNGVYGPPLVLKPENKYEVSFSDVREVPIAELGVQPGDVISLFADTLDNSPEGQSAVTPTIHLQVISVEEYNDYLREEESVVAIQEKYYEIAEQMEELAQEQEKINKAVEELQEKMANEDKPMTEEAQREKINKLIKKQNELNHKIEQLAEKMDSMGRDDPLYDIEKEFTAELKERAEELRDSLDENQKAMEELSDANSDTSSKESKLDALEAFQEDGQRQEKTIRENQEEYSDRVLQTLTDLELMNNLIGDFSDFKKAYEFQVKIVQRLEVFNINRDLSRSDELLLKRIAAEEKLIADLMKELPDRLRADADDAEIQFPKAAASARALADDIESYRLKQLADNAVNSMLLPQGPESYQMAKRLKEEMWEVIQNTKGRSMPGMNGEPNPYMEEEFDRYLSLLMEMDPENTFAQMCKGTGKGFGFGRGRGRGRGRGGIGSSRSGGGPADGYSQPRIGLLGNERLGGKDKNKDNPGGKGQRGGEGKNAGNLVVVQGDEKSIAHSKDSIKTQAGASSSQALINDYEELIEAYFEKLSEDDQ